AQNSLWIRLLVFSLGRIVPVEIENWPVSWIGRARELFANHATKVVKEPQVGPAIASRLDRCVVPLQKPLSVGERSALLRVRGGRQEEDFGLDIGGLQLSACDLR